MITNDIITKISGKFQTSTTKQVRISQTFLIRPIQKCNFRCWIWAIASKVMGIFVNVWLVLPCPITKYGHITCPKWQILKIFYFGLILHLILGKVMKFLVEKFSTSEVNSQKCQGGHGTLLVLLGLSVSGALQIGPQNIWCTLFGFPLKYHHKQNWSLIQYWCHFYISSLWLLV